MNRSQAINVNNYAAGLIHDGRLEEAIAALSNGLTDSRQMMRGEAFDTQAIVDFELCMGQWCKDEMDQETDECEEGFIYRKPIHIPKVVGSSYTSGLVVCTAIVFNLALAHHLFATNTDKQSTLLMKALELYKLASVLHRKINAQARSSTLFIRMATINNIGVIYRSLHDTTTARKCFQNLLSTLVYVTERNESTGYNLDGFYRNTSHLIIRCRTAGAA